MPHGFCGRRGGVSKGALWGLNVGYGSGDDPEAVAENRRRVVDAVLPGAHLATVHQFHSAEAVLADHAWPHEARPHADAMATDRPGLLLGILTADCVPILLADVQAGVIGAAHAGWRGALAGVTDAVIDRMESLGASSQRISAAIGPCIAQPSYEVDEAFRERLLVADEANERFFVAKGSSWPHFDLPGYVEHRLAARNLGRVEQFGMDTYSDPDRFFSYRRATHLGEPDYGRQIAVIGLTGSLPDRVDR